MDVPRSGMDAVKAECNECGGTGLTRLEVLGGGDTAILCNECAGRGFLVIRFIPFAGLTRRTDVARVDDPRVGGRPITYDEFLQWWQDRHSK